MTTNSHIQVNNQGKVTGWIGPQATDLYRMTLVKQAIEMHVKFGGRMKLTRGFTITKVLATASTYTNVKYKRTQTSQALEDMQRAIQGVKATIEVKHEQP